MSINSEIQEALQTQLAAGREPEALYLGQFQMLRLMQHLEAYGPVEPRGEPPHAQRLHITGLPVFMVDAFDYCRAV